MIKLESSICSTLETALSHEWLETNGIGGFASGTVSGANNRRYHGLLTAAARPPLGRITILAKFDEELIIDDEVFELSTNVYPGSIAPKGYEAITGFRLDPFPIWTYECGGVRLEKRCFMPHGKNAVVCRWKILNARAVKGRDVRLRLRPLVSFVDYHHLQHVDGAFDAAYSSGNGTVSLQPYPDRPKLFISHSAASINESGFWYRNFEYAIERERGFDHHEDLYQPFVVEFSMRQNEATVIAATEDVPHDQAVRLEAAEIKRRRSLVKKARTGSEAERQLVLAADQFIVARGEGESVIAGYPWFSDWGRDTMIALPGLTLATGRPEIAKRIIQEFAKHISEGMLPNRFPDAGETPEYNTVDATLWYFEAIRAYTAATGDHEMVRGELYEKLADIVAWHLRGTRYNIHIDTDGLLYAGSPDVQLTWMDAKIGDRVITPRSGKPVEIQALWYNALRVMADLARRFGHDEDRERFDAMADLAKLSFNGLFWNEADQCLFDVVENGHRDSSVRPNQLFAISLEHPILNTDRWQAVVDKAETELLTPVGLRSLSPRDPAYVPVYIGSPFDRDSAYHQGTVWGWLIGPFVDAYRRVYGGEKDLNKRIEGIVAGFGDHLYEAGVGQISEIFDAEPPHTPRGCPAQAWSVGELLRVIDISHRQR